MIFFFFLIGTDYPPKTLFSDEHETQSNGSLESNVIVVFL